jgi:hypothetical protein
MKNNIKTLLLKAAFVAVVAGGVAAGANAVNAAAAVSYDQDQIGADDPNLLSPEQKEELNETYEQARERISKL